MQLSHRLFTIASGVPQGSTVIDVGTDHAYIPIYLIKNHIVPYCIATDIHKGPLQKAELNMRFYQIKNIDLRLTNGIEGVQPGEGNVIIMAGMGGYLIIDILKRGLEVIKAADKLILQPQQDIWRVREYLHHIGFIIDNEEFIEEDGKYYTVIEAVLGNEIYEKPYDYKYGKILIEKKSDVFKRYMLEKEKRLLEVYDNVSQNNSDFSIKRKMELAEELKMHREVIRCIF